MAGALPELQWMGDASEQAAFVNQVREVLGPGRTCSSKQDLEDALQTIGMPGAFFKTRGIIAPKVQASHLQLFLRLMLLVGTEQLEDAGWEDVESFQPQSAEQQPVDLSISLCKARGLPSPAAALRQLAQHKTDGLPRGLAELWLIKTPELEDAWPNSLIPMHGRWRLVHGRWWLVHGRWRRLVQGRCQGTPWRGPTA